MLKCFCRFLLFGGSGGSPRSRRLWVKFFSVFARVCVCVCMSECGGVPLRAKRCRKTEESKIFMSEVHIKRSKVNQRELQSPLRVNYEHVSAASANF